MTYVLQHAAPLSSGAAAKRPKETLLEGHASSLAKARLTSRPTHPARPPNCQSAHLLVHPCQEACARGLWVGGLAHIPEF